MPPASSRTVSSSKPPVASLPQKPAPSIKAASSPPLPSVPPVSSPPPLTVSPPISVPLERTISSTTEGERPTAPAANKGPAIPPKPSTATLQPPSMEDSTSSSTTSTPLAKRVSLLAQQFDNKSAPSSPVVTPTASTNQQQVATPTTATTHTQSPASFLSPPPLQHHQQHETEDPFLDDEISDISSRDSDDDYADDDEDENVGHDLGNIRYTAAPLKHSPPAIPTTKGDKPKQRPPPPPPSKKYHSTARQTESTNHTSGGTTTLAMPIPIPVQQQQQQRSLTHPNTTTTAAATTTTTTTTGISSTASSPGNGISAPPPILPPRPANVNVASFEPLPQLPPRPSTSTLARSHTINHSYDHGHTIGRRTHLQDNPSSMFSDSQQPPLPQQLSAATVNLKRSQTMGGPTKRDGLPATPANLLTKSVYPDFSSATRNPPLVDEKGEQRLVGGQHRGSNQPMAASGSRLATGTQQAKVWNTTTCKTIFGVDLVGPNDNERIRSYVFAPPLRPADEGRYLWAGMLDGTLVAMDTTTNDIIGKTSVCHKHAVTFMLRRRNVDLWTLDESGLLAIWPVMKHAQQQQQQQQYHPFEMQPIKHLVTPKAVTALIVGMDLWISSGRSIHLFRGLGNNTNALSDDKPVRIPNDLGNITQLVTIPFHAGQVFASHDDGKVSAWDSKTMEKMQVNAVSLYGICAMVTVCDYYLWTGYNTGMIYVYDTRPEKWLVVKTWRAHQGAVVSLHIDDSSFVRNENSLHVISGDSHGNVAIWDGLMVENWQDQQLQKQALNYCTYKPARVMICSWNIDANKPEKLVGQDNELVHQWLGDAEDPDIIVVGIQEIVDLESKKQTAKSLFATRKKNDSLQEAEEMLTHRYRLWHDHLIRVIGDNYGHDTYTVIKTDQLVGLFSCIFVKNSEMHRVWNCDSTVVKTGLKVMNKSIHGNKGGIAIRFLFDHSSLCFVNCHLAAGQSHTQDRNANAESILHSANFPDYGAYLDVFTNGGDGSLILDHEHCFLSGDLNYRIAMDRKDVIDLVKRKDKMAAWEALQIHDQLKRQNITNPLFKLLWFKEPPLLFDPTYKYDRGTDNYDSSEKKRVPAWCDRVLCRSSMAHNIYYRRHEVKASDHRPISAAYDIQVKEIDSQKRDRLLEKIEKDWYHSLEKLIMVKKACYVADFERCSVEQASQLLQEAHWNVEQVVQKLF